MGHACARRHLYTEHIKAVRGGFDGHVRGRIDLFFMRASGTICVPPQIFREYVKATALSIASHGIRKRLIVNGHGENTPPPMDGAGELIRQRGIFAAVMMALLSRMIEAEPGHGGAGETSANLYFHIHLVKMEIWVNTKRSSTLGSLKVVGFNGIGTDRYAWYTIDRTETGVLDGAGEMIEATRASEEGEGSIRSLS